MTSLPDTATPAHADTLLPFQETIDYAVRIVGSGIEAFGVTIIVLGIIAATLSFLRNPGGPNGFQDYKIQIGRTLLLGLEVLVAADIVKTVATELTFRNLGELAALVVIRTFLTWALVLEIEGRWPWQREPKPETTEKTGF